jgi:hypothetical protein
MNRPSIEFENKDENEAVATITGDFWLLREDKDDFQAEFKALIEKYAI